MPKSKTKGVFCLEGDWDGDLKSRKSIQPVLQLLEHAGEPSIPSIRRDIGTIPELEHYLRKWCLKRYKNYPILYLAFHGSPGTLYLDNSKTTVDLDWLEERLEGACKGKVIHLGSCQTMNVHGSRLNKFLVRTGALAVCCYKIDVEWMYSAAFEIMLFGCFQRYSMTKQGMEAVKRMVEAEIPGLAKAQAFRMVIPKGGLA
jgi:hypothetical protein